MEELIFTAENSKSNLLRVERILLDSEGRSLLFVSQLFSLICEIQMLPLVPKEFKVVIYEHERVVIDFSANLNFQSMNKAIEYQKWHEQNDEEHKRKIKEEYKALLAGSSLSGNLDLATIYLKCKSLKCDVTQTFNNLNCHFTIIAPWNRNERMLKSQ